MSFDMDEDILQDFLVEAGEILELLQEQLVELENNPDDSNLLNAIFRGFHTVKGGAGFLSLTELVDACHGAENVFDILRTGKRQVTPELMDVILQALDTVNAMFAQVQSRQPLTPADPALLDALHRLSEPDDGSSEPVAAAPPVSAPPVTETPPEASASDAAGIDDMDEDEFERLLDELHGGKAPGQAASAEPPALDPELQGDMTDDEFEAILDQLHGKGSFKSTEGEAKAAPAEKSAPAGKGDEITDDEFESLLDDLHGKGKSPQAVADKTPAERKPAPKAPEPAAAAASTPAAKPATAPAAPKQLLRQHRLHRQPLNMRPPSGLIPSGWMKS